MPDAVKPVLLYDGKCGFCGIWIRHWQEITGDAVDYAPSQEAGARYPQIPPEEFQRSVQLVLPSGEVLSGAHAVFRCLAFAPSRQWPLALYQRAPGFAALSEAAYRFIAGHRNLFHRLTVLTVGREVHTLRYEGIERLFRRSLALMWLAAFVSFGLQAKALIGSEGIQPVSLYLARVSEYLGEGAWRAAPGLFWLQSSNGAVVAVCIAGALSSLLVLFGVFWRGALVIAFVSYLSLVNGAQEFLGYQWDILLLESGFLAIFLGYSRAVVWLFRWLLFRLMFLSGAVKLLSGDPTWSGLSALFVHFETQPIPTPLAWYAHQLPHPVLKAACFLTLFVELVIPFLVLGPRRFRLLAAPFLIGLQALILLTGNYAFFNWLTIALCVFLFHDAHLPGVLRTRVAGERFVVPLRVRRALAVCLVIVTGLLSTLLMLQTLTVDLPRGARALVSAAAPFGISSSYGLFARMTTLRPEIVVEGSRDGVEWVEYEFRFKPGRPDRPPPWVAPHQPRLDWQMWFAALGTYPENVWFLNFVARLLQGTPEVTGLLERNPFEGKPPALIRAQLYEYRFTDGETRRRTGNWWTRRAMGLYLPPVSLASLSELPILRRPLRGQETPPSSNQAR